MNTLVLMHGLGSNSTRWWHFASHSRLRRRWRMLFPDLRGHAGSQERGRVGVREWCADLAALLDAARCPRAVIGGHCLGANFALHFAARHPERTAGLVLIEPLPREALTGAMRRASLLRPLLLFVASAIGLANALGLRRRRLASMDLEQWDHAVRAGEIRPGRFASPLADLRSTPSAAYLQSLIATGERLPALERIRAPALVVLSTSGALADPGRSRAALERLPNAEIVAIRASHFIPTDEPQRLCAAIDDWLAANEERLAGA